MDFVHDTLSEGRPYRILTVVDNWSRSSPVLEAGFRMSGALVSQVLDRVLGEGQRPRSIDPVPCSRMGVRRGVARLHSTKPVIID
jgi:hypothetical protein